MCDFGLFTVPAAVAAASTAATAGTAAAVGTTVAAGAATAAAASTPWLMYAGLGLSALQGVGSVFQMSQQSQAQGAAANYQAQVARNNQAVADWKAQDAEQRGAVTRAKAKMAGDQRFGSTQAALASQGTDLSGSSADILGDTAAANQLDQLTITSNAQREAFGYKVAALGAGSEAQFAAQRAASIDSAAPFSMASTLIGTAGTVATKWYAFNKGLVA